MLQGLNPLDEKQLALLPIRIGVRGEVTKVGRYVVGKGGKVHLHHRPIGR